MALKPIELRELLARSGAADDQPPDQADNGPVARFTIGNQVFLIFCEEIFHALCSGLIYQREDIIGELKLDNKLYFITSHKKLPSLNGQKSLINILTKREIQVMLLVAQGKVNKEIADQLKISEWTVSSHLRRIFAKLGVDSRAAMIFRCSKFLLAS